MERSGTPAEVQRMRKCADEHRVPALRKRNIPKEIDIVFVVEGMDADKLAAERIRKAVERMFNAYADNPARVNRQVAAFRIRLIVYGGIRWFGVPQIEEFEFVQSIEQKKQLDWQLNEMCGCLKPQSKDGAVCALTALKRAMNSRWCEIRNRGTRYRHLIVMFTGAAEASERSRRLLEECEQMWERMEQCAKRLMIFGGGSVWNEPIMEWDNTMGCFEWQKMTQEELEEAILMLL